MFIRRLYVQNFRSFRQIDLALPDFSVLVGANAAGKSNFYHGGYGGEGDTASELPIGKCLRDEIVSECAGRAREPRPYGRGHLARTLHPVPLAKKGRF
ncbi:MAG: AAA family ATPase [Fimbriimonadales bacterium]|nr:AAA family ATPase [Fimbriimonadales bacterium]